MLLASALAVGAPGARAAEPAVPSVWLNAGALSLHFERDQDLREDNVGLGLEVAFKPGHAVVAGSFINSNRARSRYAGYAWQPFAWHPGADVRAGLAVGAFDGYPGYRNGGWFIAPLPMLSVEGRRLGVNVFLVPTIPNRVEGAIAVQLKLRIR